MRKLGSGEKDNAGFSASGEAEAQQTECYLDRLPDNVLENIMRLMSAAPRASAWAEQLAVADICTLFSLGGEMERVARESFRSLSFDAQSSRLLPGYEWKELRAYRLNISRTNISAAKLLNLASPSYTALKIQDPLSSLFRQPAHIDEFLRKCPNVKDLEIYSASTCMWLEKLGPRLERLEMRISCLSICQSIAGYCTQLRELHMGGVCGCAMGLSDLWEKVGGTLEKLSATFMFSASMEIRNIQLHCRKIRWLHITEEELVRPALAECIVSYGEQLKCALLADMNPSQLQAIVTACPNAKFHMSMAQSCHGNSLKLVGSRVERVAVFEYGVSDLCSLAKGWNACPNIEEITLCKELSLSYVRAMFTKPKPALLELDLQIGFAEQISTVREIFDCVAGGTGSLRHINLSVGWLADGLFDKLVARNQWLQEFICAAHQYDDDDDDDDDDGKCDVAKMAEVILGLPKLKACWIFVDNGDRVPEETRKKLQEIVRPHRHRQIVVHMIGHNYLR